MFREFGDQLNDGQTITLTNVVQETNGVVLEWRRGGYCHSRSWCYWYSGRWDTGVGGVGVIGIGDMVIDRGRLVYWYRGSWGY